jgi:hypothetical protein
VDGLHVEGVTQDEGDVVFGAEVADPVPGEEALDADDDIGAERSQGVEEDLFAGRNFRLSDDIAALVEDADGEEPGMEVDAAVELVLPVVEIHGLLPRYRWGPEPASWLEGYALPENPTLRQG